MNNNKSKRVLAVIGIVLLLCLYIVTLILAIIGNENTTPWFMGCICATVIVPVLIWVYNWLYNRLRQDVYDAAEKAEKAEKGENPKTPKRNDQ